MLCKPWFFLNLIIIIINCKIKPKHKHVGLTCKNTPIVLKKVIQVFNMTLFKFAYTVWFIQNCIFVSFTFIHLSNLHNSLDYNLIMYLRYYCRYFNYYWNFYLWHHFPFQRSPISWDRFTLKIDLNLNSSFLR